MERSLYKLDKSCLCRACALVGAGVIAVSAVPQHAGAQVTQRWSAREFQENVFGPDNAVDVAYWRDKDAIPPMDWVYMTGYQTTANGATVFATHRYDANHPGPIAPFDERAFYPADPEDATGTHRAVAIDIDPKTGDVYVTGESNNADDPTGFDYVIIKYDKNLDPDPAWVATSPNDDAAIRWNNDAFNGDDRPVGLSLGSSIIWVPPAQNAIGITGTSYNGLANGLDITTVLFHADTGDLYDPWVLSLNNPNRRAGSAGADDRPVDIELYWTAGDSQSGEPVLHTVVAGTIKQVNSGQGNDDIWTTEYDEGGNVLWEDVYNGPMNGDDVATAMSSSSLFEWRCFRLWVHAAL